MKRRFSFKWMTLSSLLISASLGADLPQIYESLPVVEAHHFLEEADARWEAFVRELEWFLNVSEARPLHVESGLSFEHQKEAIARMQEGFLKLREQMAAVFGAQGEGTLAASLQAAVQLELTDWYTRYLEEHLFPVQWQVAYEAYEQSLKSPR